MTPKLVPLSFIALVAVGLCALPVASVADSSASGVANAASSGNHALAGTSTALGQVAPNPNVANPCGAPFTGLQATSVVPNQYVAPATAGVITSFSTGAKTGVNGNVRAVMFVPAGVGTYTQVGKSDFGAVTPGTVSTFPTRIPVPALAILGIQYDNGALACGVAQASSTITYNAAYNPDSPAGPFTGTNGSYLLNVAAVWESDADGDGYGDVTQDLCPESKLTQAACPAPDTAVTKAPKKKSTKRKAKITFSSTIAGSTFTCKVDKKPAAPCTSPFKKKYKYGMHTVVITAISPAGIVDPTPVTVKFKVKRPTG